ncbi:ABC transporter permease family protein [Caproicibacter fermentans]|uniref:ABC transporter permease n=1 Tax=Caproicibacter fermentans TaxID=2576756 RepID=A0A7G8TC62_9FIRM|nr:hypothetical protein [Caproicibacter fermentans]QNK41203.1 hypothetical protein HCR03_02520 [Caproicibacter fermentans]
MGKNVYVATHMKKVPNATRKFPAAALARFAFRHIRRSGFKSILTIIVATCFILAMGWMNWTIVNDKSEIDRMYKSISVDAEIVSSDMSVYYSGGGGGVIKPDTVGTVLNSGFVKSSYLEETARAAKAFAKQHSNASDHEAFLYNPALHAFNQPKIFFSDTGKNLKVNYAHGWNESLFTKNWPINQEVPILISVNDMLQLKLKPGDHMIIISNNQMKAVQMNCIVAGQYQGSLLTAWDNMPILLPSSSLEAFTDGGFCYAVARFTLKPNHNREMSKFRMDMKNLMAMPSSGFEPLNFVLWDEQLRQVLQPLEKNLSLLNVLFPVTITISALISMALTILLLLQCAKEAAIMRALGATKTRMCVGLCVEQLFLCSLGILFGLAAFIVLCPNIEQMIWSVIGCTGAYFGGCLSGVLFSTVSLIRRKPLDLLQVKE